MRDVKQENFSGILLRLLFIWILVLIFPAQLKAAGVGNPWSGRLVLLDRGQEITSSFFNLQNMSPGDGDVLFRHFITEDADGMATLPGGVDYIDYLVPAMTHDTWAPVELKVPANQYPGTYRLVSSFSPPYVDSAVSIVVNDPGPIYVDDDAPNDPCYGNPDFSDSNEDGSPAHPFDAIQEAIDIAFPGSTVIVLDGIYTGIGNRDIDPNGLSFTIRSQNGSETCIIDCEQLGRGFYFHSGEDGNSLLDGFTIINGSGIDLGGGFTGGGGMLVTSSSPTVSNCKFVNNTADMGGGMYNGAGSAPTVMYCTFEINTSTWPTGNSNIYGGAGMNNKDSSPTVTGCKFIGNTALNMGGGIINSGTWPIGSAAVITNCVFIENTAGLGGGAIFNNNSSPVVSNCTFAQNSDGIINEAAISNNSSHPIITNCVFWNNEGNPIGGYNPTVTYSCIQGGWAGLGSNNIDTDPCFADVDANDFHLMSQAGRYDPNTQSWVTDANTSPCIDAGDPTTSIGWELYPNGGIVNMGAYGGTIEASKSYCGDRYSNEIAAVDINGDCIVDWKDFAFMAYHWLEDNN